MKEFENNTDALESALQQQATKTKREIRLEKKKKNAKKSLFSKKNKKADVFSNETANISNQEESDTQQNNAPLTKREQRKAKKRRKNGLHVALKVLAVILVLLLLLGGGAYFLLKDAMQNFGFGKFSTTNVGSSKADVFDAKSQLSQFAVAGGDFPEDGIINLLVFGFDASENRVENSGRDVFLTDAIMIFHIDINQKTIKVLSIPRDSYVPIYDSGWTTKINAAYATGYWNGETEAESHAMGMRYMIGTISNLLNGLKIHYYMGVDMDGFKSIINSLGGVTVNVPQDLYNENGHGDSILIHKGEQTLNGSDLLYYARYRAYERGDIDRTVNQQNILKALISTLTSKGTMSKLPQVYNSSKDIFLTSLTFEQIASLAYTFSSFDMNNLETKSMPGSFLNINGVSYWGISEYGKNKICKEWYGL